MQILPTSLNDKVQISIKNQLALSKAKGIQTPTLSSTDIPIILSKSSNGKDSPRSRFPGRRTGLHLSETILDLAGDPWPSIWYSFQLLLKLVTPGEPTRSEAKLRAKVTKVVDKNIERLEEYEGTNPEAPLKTIRNLSVMTGGGKTGPLSEFASESTNLNLFGSFSFISSKVRF